MEFCASVQGFLAEDFCQNVEGFMEFIKIRLWMTIRLGISAKCYIISTFCPFSLFWCIKLGILAINILEIPKVLWKHKYCQFWLAEELYRILCWGLICGKLKSSLASQAYWPNLSSCNFVGSSFSGVVILWYRLPIRSSSWKANFMCGCLPMRLSSNEVVFLWGRFSFSLSSSEIFFLLNHLPMKLLFMIYFYYEHQLKGPPVGIVLSTIYEISISPRSYSRIKKQDPEYTLLYYKSSAFKG